MSTRVVGFGMTHTVDSLLARSIPEPNTGCFLWLGAVTGATGYGAVRHGGTTRLAHRLVYELANGDVPSDVVVRHRCDVRSCVNPGHLVAGSQRENMADMESRGRRVSPRGERHARAKLTDARALALRSRFDAGEPYRALAQEFGLPRELVWRICKRKTWNHLEVK